MDFILSKLMNRSTTPTTPTTTTSSTTTIAQNSEISSNRKNQSTTITTNDVANKVDDDDIIKKLNENQDNLKNLNHNNIQYIQNNNSNNCKGNKDNKEIEPNNNAEFKAKEILNLTSTEINPNKNINTNAAPFNQNEINNNIIIDSISNELINAISERDRIGILRLDSDITIKNLNTILNLDDDKKNDLENINPTHQKLSKNDISNNNFNSIPNNDIIKLNTDSMNLNSELSNEIKNDCITSKFDVENENFTIKFNEIEYSNDDDDIIVFEQFKLNPLAESFVWNRNNQENESNINSSLINFNEQEQYELSKFEVLEEEMKNIQAIESFKFEAAQKQLNDNLNNNESLNEIDKSVVEFLKEEQNAEIVKETLNEITSTEINKPIEELRLEDKNNVERINKLIVDDKTALTSSITVLNEINNNDKEERNVEILKFVTNTNEINNVISPIINNNNAVSAEPLATNENTIFEEKNTDKIESEINKGSTNSNKGVNEVIKIDKNTTESLKTECSIDSDLKSNTEFTILNENNEMTNSSSVLENINKNSVENNNSNIYASTTTIENEIKSIPACSSNSNNNNEIKILVEKTANENLNMLNKTSDNVLQTCAQENILNSNITDDKIIENENVKHQQTLLDENETNKIHGGNEALLIDSKQIQLKEQPQGQQNQENILKNFDENFSNFAIRDPNNTTSSLFSTPELVSPNETFTEERLPDIINKLPSIIVTNDNLNISSLVDQFNKIHVNIIESDTNLNATITKSSGSPSTISSDDEFAECESYPVTANNSKDFIETDNLGTHINTSEIPSNKGNDTVDINDNENNENVNNLPEVADTKLNLSQNIEDFGNLSSNNLKNISNNEEIVFNTTQTINNDSGNATLTQTNVSLDENPSLILESKVSENEKEIFEEAKLNNKELNDYNTEKNLNVDDELINQNLGNVPPLVNNIDDNDKNLQLKLIKNLSNSLNVSSQWTDIVSSVNTNDQEILENSHIDLNISPQEMNNSNSEQEDIPNELNDKKKDMNVTIDFENCGERENITINMNHLNSRNSLNDVEVENINQQLINATIDFSDCPLNKSKNIKMMSLLPNNEIIITGHINDPQATSAIAHEFDGSGDNEKLNKTLNISNVRNSISPSNKTHNIDNDNNIEASIPICDLNTLKSLETNNLNETININSNTNMNNLTFVETSKLDKKIDELQGEELVLQMKEQINNLASFGEQYFNNNTNISPSYDDVEPMDVDSQPDEKIDQIENCNNNSFKIPKIPAFNEPPLGFGRTDNTDQFKSIENNDIDLVFQSCDFDYLLKHGNNTVKDIRKDSLLLKFDPLFGKPVPIEKNLYNYTVIEEEDANISSNTSLSEKKLLNEEKLQINDNKVLINVPIVTEENIQVIPDKPIKSKINKSKSVSSSSTSSVNSQSVKLEEFETLEKLLQFEEKKVHTLNKNMSIDVIQNNIKIDNNIQSNENINSNIGINEKRELKMEDLEKKIKKEVLETEDVEKKLKDAEQREEALLKRITEKDKTITKMGGVIEAYEKAIAELISEKEEMTQNYEKQLNEIKAERDLNKQHLESLESTFNDLHAKYERSKQQLTKLKASEEELQLERKRNLENLSLQEQRYEKMKNHALQQLEIANNKLEHLSKNHNLEVTKLKALLKKEELAKASLHEQLIQKSKENEELCKICEELINGGSSS